MLGSTKKDPRMTRVPKNTTSLGMFDTYNAEKAAYSASFGDFEESKPWETFTLEGSKKVDPTDKNAPPGQYMLQAKPVPLKDATGRSEWYGVMDNGTKMRRINKTRVLTDRGVSIVRALPDDKAKHEAAMSRLFGDGEAESEPVRKIVGTFVSYDPPRLELGNILNELGEATQKVRVKQIIDPHTGEWKLPA